MNSILTTFNEFLGISFELFMRGNRGEEKGNISFIYFISHL